MNNGERDRAREQNRQAWNRLVEKKNRFTRPAKDEDLVDPLGTVDAIGWLGGDIRGLKLLCLAAGGGKAMLMRDDWKRVFEPDAIADSIQRIT